MGKKKRIPNQSDTQPPISRSPSSDTMPCSSGTELMSEEKPLLSVDASELNTLSPVWDVKDNSMKLLNAHPATAHHHQNLGRSIFLKHSRYHYGHQYFRRNSASHTNASSRGKGAFSRDERLSFKLATQCNPQTGYHSEIRGKEICRPERLRSSSLVMDAAASSDAVKMVCGLCQTPLRRKPYFLGSTLSSGELSVVAVLVCGHVYHAECLEQKTCLEDRRDPPCPLCLGLPPKEDNSGGQE
ncbi:hypothetical protein F2P56_002835 [Juglans regia]|uniref:Uncharacterized protein LOC108995667 isoform X2 n=2 Tax=Juglans regia TaxID=51240 RepID=A0A2I4F592_JUGRE|nr:uncharacterized protein LOC108995667 isoform X2 [Juglans regia]KAF5482249.1 hypothetical protein F2P56_002835 [Juglans regia]